MKKCSKDFLKLCVKTVALVLFYFTFSITLTFYNKGVVSKFQYPLIMTYIHLVIKFLIASLVRNILEWRNKKERTYLNWRVYLKSMAPVGISSVLDIGLSNWSLQFITITLYTMTKTSAIVFVLIFAVVFKVEVFRWLQLIVVLCISIGLLLFTFKSTQFQLTGFLMCLGASSLSGVRWVLTQKVSQKSELGLSNPVDFMYHVQPWMISGLLPLLLYNEGFRFSMDADFEDSHNDTQFVLNMLILVCGAVLAFFLEFSEFLLVAQTSSLTLSVSGIIKECCTLLLAALINDNRMSALNGVGLVACLLGISVHIYLKATKIQAELPNKASSTAEMVALVASGSSEDEDVLMFDHQHSNGINNRAKMKQSFV